MKKSLGMHKNTANHLNKVDALARLNLDRFTKKAQTMIAHTLGLRDKDNLNLIESEVIFKNKHSYLNHANQLYTLGLYVVKCAKTEKIENERAKLYFQLLAIYTSMRLMRGEGAWHRVAKTPGSILYRYEDSLLLDLQSLYRTFSEGYLESHPQNPRLVR